MHDALPGAAHEYSSHATHEVPEARCPAPHDAGTGEVEGVTLLVRLGVPLPVRLPVGVADTVDDDDADAPRLGVAVGVDALDGVMLLVGVDALLPVPLPEGVPLPVGVDVPLPVSLPVGDEVTGAGGPA